MEVAWQTVGLLAVVIASAVVRACTGALKPGAWVVLNALSLFAIAPDAAAGKGAGLLGRLGGLFSIEAGLRVGGGWAAVTMFS